jgi:hypothetical protein
MNINKLEVFYNNNKIKNNDFFLPSQLQDVPKIIINGNPNKYYSLIMYDPDAVGGTFIHWAISNITKNNIKIGKTIVPYKGPAPPPKSGKHRYIFELFEQDNILNIYPLNERRFTIDEMKNIMKVSNEIAKFQLISQNESGGKRKKTFKRRKLVKSKKNKSNKSKRNLKN